ncbi:hypothetical protein E0Z10_g4757 [Xylaria hypoxylon]|uniref:Kinesin motor domain-containing protein n=1 Tax=Xylaria hypoxylon TaxID=37992 RepID=A0A4Z0YXL4_9PEZI|nr:hypothetical protein E0Z10_g4757 [Xylaria hypoxylon]
MSDDQRLDCVEDTVVPQNEEVRGGANSDDLQAHLSSLVSEHIDNLSHNLNSFTEGVKNTVYDDDELEFQVGFVRSHINHSLSSLAQEITTAVHNANTGHQDAHIEFAEQVEQMKRNNSKFLLAISRMNDIRGTKDNVDENILENSAQLASKSAKAGVELGAKQVCDDTEYWKQSAQEFEESLKLQSEIMQQQKAQLAKNEKDIHLFTARYQAMVEELAAAKGNIQVICRIKPGGADEDLITFTNPDEGHRFLPWSNLRATYQNDSNRTESRDFEFQRAFGNGESNETIFNEVKDFAHSAALGNACTIMAYGATGTGKSHTFLSENGLVNSYIDLLFNLAAEERGKYEYEFYLSAIEIYLNKVFDLLLTPVNRQKVEVKLGAESNLKLDSQQQAIEIIKHTIERRESASTKQNETSSRSHFVLSLRIVRKMVGETPTSGVMNFLDTCGSERAGRNLSSGTPSPQEALIFEQGRDINESLLDLGKSIRSVATGVSPRGRGYL